MSEQVFIAKTCGVCGDKAKVRNFGAIACESCKCFFRRAVINPYTMKCGFDGKCDTNKRNRKSCRKCRLDKCYAIGMRKELVMTKTKKQESNESPDPDARSSNDCSDLDLFDDDFELVATDDQITDGIKELEKILDSSCLSSGSESETLLHKEVVPIVKPIAIFDKQLNDMEISKLVELCEAASHFRDFTCYADTKYCSQLDDLDQLFEFMTSVNMFDQNIKSSVNFAKTIDKFREMPEKEQVTLIKNNCWRIVMLKNSFAFDLERGHWTFAINSDYSIRYNMDIFRKLNGNAFENCKQFWNMFDPEWTRDRTLIQLIMAIVMFDSPDLDNKLFIKLSQQMYLYLLQRYLIQKYRSEDKSNHYFSSIMSCLGKFYKIPVQPRRVVREHSKRFTPLTTETFSD